MQSRRNFIRQTCVACVGMSALGILLDACVSSQSVLKPAIENNSFKIALDNFQKSQTHVLRNKSLPYDILVIKDQEQYTALQMRCTHNDVALNLSGKKIICTAHGSEFDMKGNVTKEPALKSLTKYRTTTNEQYLFIHLN